MDENQMMRFGFETAVASVFSEYGAVNDEEVKSICQSLMANDLYKSRSLRVSGGDYKPIFQSTALAYDNILLREIYLGKRGYRILYQDGRYVVQAACMPYGGGSVLYLESFRDITSVFESRDEHYRIYRNLTILLLALAGLAMFGISRWLTRPIWRLSTAARRISGGQYQHRARVFTQDEIGSLAQDFNAMADALEKKIVDLEDAARRQEDFVASFAHELKTPLTAMIGYADMLRSVNLPESQRFLAANYIFGEGKRLEALSLKLMELIVLRRSDYVLMPHDAANVAKKVEQTVFPALEKAGVFLETACEHGKIFVEPDLFLNLLQNLIDNAKKASAPGGKIELTGKNTPEGYVFSVTDHGKGIAPDELSKITEAFYMVDKSRSRKEGGAGLGLAICADIAKIHNTSLQFESREGAGTTVWFCLPCSDETAQEKGK